MENGDVHSTQKKILIIDDNPAFLDTLQIRLEQNGYQTACVQDGLEGLDAARKELPDLIILDLALPGMLENQKTGEDPLDRQFGHKLCRMMKFDRKLCSIPVIILTASDSYKDIVLASKCGADAFIMKSSKTDILLNTIRKLLDKERPVSSETGRRDC